MKSFFNNIIVYETALLICGISWVFGGTYGPYAREILPWFCVILLQGIFAFPQKKRNEFTTEARVRVAESIYQDPLSIVCLLFSIYLAIPFVNKGLCEICDYPAIAAGERAEPLLQFLPFCVNRVHHFTTFLWFVAVILVVLAIRHSFSRAGRKLLLEIILWNGFALAIVGVVQISTGATGPLWTNLDNETSYFFSTFGYPNMAGCYFMMIFVIGMAVWRDKLERMRVLLKNDNMSVPQSSHTIFWRKHYALIPTFVAYLAALNTFSRASIILVTSIAVVVFAHTIVSAFHKIDKAKRFKARVASVVAFAVVVFASLFFMPDEMRSELNTVDSTEVLDRFSGKREVHVDVGLKIFKQYPLYGVGGWGYKHFSISRMTNSQLRSVDSPGSINVHNDFLQFLVEHGMIGMGFIIAIFVMLILPVAKKYKYMVKLIRFLPEKKRPPSPSHIFILPASAFILFVGVIAVLVHAAGDCILRSPANLILLFIIIASIDAYMPEFKIDNE